MSSTPFYMVVSSLPRLGTQYKVQETPISRMQLEKRLHLIPADKSALLFDIERLVWTSWFQNETTLHEAKIRLHKLKQIDAPVITDLIQWYLDLRSIFVALRMRNKKEAAPEAPQGYWLTRWSLKLTQHWNEPDFGLKTVYPWLPKVAADFANQDTSAVEEFLLDHIWHYLSVLESRHQFDFDALILYILRWNIIDYWSKFNKDNTLKCLDELCLGFESRLP